MRKRKFASAESVNDVYIVETICKKKIRSNKEPLYFIKWKDWDDKYNTWEPLSNILDKSLIDIFEEEQKEKQKMKKENAKTHQELCQEPKEVDHLKTMDDEKRDTIHDGGGDETMERCGIEDKSDKCFTETEFRPKIYLRIPKHRIHAPTMDMIKGVQDNDFVDHGIERVRKCSNVEEEWPFCSKVSPTYLSKEESLHRPITNGNHIRLEKAPSSNKPNHFLDKHSQIHSDKTLTTSDFIIRKPRKLLSINEYSAKMKKRHKKSKQDKLKMEDKKSMHFSSHKHRDEVNVENKMEKKPESKVVRPLHERPLVALENHIESWSEKPLNKDMMESVAAIKAVKAPITERFKYHANTIVTDVTVKNLSVTIREMPYEDFIDSETSRYLMIRVPVQSDWMKRYHGSLKETKQKHTAESSEIQEVVKIDDKKPKRLDRFNETNTIMTNFRRPGRPRSVDSYKTSIDKNYSTLFFKNPFTTTNSPVKTSSKLCPESVNNGTVLNCANEPHSDSGNSNPNANKSPLHICIEDCDEVDVVGGIESDHSFVGSLQAETVTMSTTQIRESMNPINTSSVTSIIQSLLQSYSYNSMMMPPLQTAPWMESHLAPTNHHHHHHQHHHQLYHIAHHNSNTNNGSNRSSKRNRHGTRNRNQRNHCGDNSESNNDNVDDDDDNDGDDYEGFENHDVHQLLCSSSNNNNNNNCLPLCSASVQPTNMLKFTENSNILYGQAAAAAAAVGFLSDIYINNATNPTTTMATTSQDGPIDLSLK